MKLLGEKIKFIEEKIKFIEIDSMSQAMDFYPLQKLWTKV